MENNIKKILIVDDNVSIHRDLRISLENNTTKKKSQVIIDLENDLFGEDTTENIRENNTRPDLANYTIEDAYQGEEALLMVDNAAEKNDPYAVIFMDVRMPPGIDGIQTMKRIWKKHPYTEIVICTAYSDYSWDEIISEFGDTDHLLFIKKPFDTVSVQQTALTLSKKWELDRINRNNFEIMEKKIAQRTEELNRMVDHLDNLRKKAEAATVAKGQFLSKMSHEIRTPLNGIMGMTELLLDTNLNSEQFAYAKSVKTSGDSLINIVDEVLDFSKIEAGKITVENIEFSLRTEIEGVAEITAPLANKKNLEIATLIHGNIPDGLIGDPGKLRQILLNLVNNSIKFTEKGEVLISVNCIDATPREPGDAILIQFKVADTGIGITEEEKKRLFKPFSQAKTLTHMKYGGTGLGLVISKKLCELLGGEIDLISAEGKGSTFSFSAKFTVAYHDQKEVGIDKESIKEKKCLIVSDKVTSSRIISIYITHWGGLCEEALTIEDARDKYKAAALLKKPFDVIIADFNKKSKLKPYKDIIKIIPEGAHCALISIADIGMRGDAAELKKIGYNAYLSNPLKQSQLFNAIMIVTGSGNEKDTNFNPRQFLTKYSIDQLVPERYRVLIVEDNPTNVTILAKLLSKIGINSDTVENGKLAVEAVRRHTYDMIFMDCQMPVMDGYEATKTIRKEIKRGNDIAIIAVTANVIKESKKKCIDVGMNDIITKPYKFSEIIETIKKYLNNPNI